MNSSLYGKIEKAIRYQNEPARVNFQKVQVEFRGDHDNYTVNLDGSSWNCNCHTFASIKNCSHVMALQRILHEMLDLEARTEHPELVETGTN